MSVSTGEVRAFFRDSRKESKDLSLSGSAESQSQQPQDTGIVPQQQGQKEGKKQSSGFERAACSSAKGLAIHFSPVLRVALGGVPWWHSASQQQWNPTLLSTEGKKCFSHNQSTAGFSVKNTPRHLWVKPNKFNNWWNCINWELQNTKQTQKMMAWKWESGISAMKNESKIHITEDMGSDITHTVTYNTALVTAHTNTHYAGDFHSSPLHPRWQVNWWVYSLT